MRRRWVDQIIVVTGEIFSLLRELAETFRMTDWELRLHTRETDPEMGYGGDFAFLTAATTLRGGLELQAVQPLDGDTMYQRFLQRYGSGILGLREQIAEDEWEDWLQSLAQKGLAEAQRRGDGEVWFDLTGWLGGYMGFIRRKEPGKAAKDGAHAICQICIATDDVHRTARNLAECLGLGPWEIGECNNQTVTAMTSSGYPAGAFPPAAFLTGIGGYENLQFELIEPVKGPLPYFAYLNRRGTGFHHMKEVVPDGEWENWLERFRSLGIGTLLAGKIGPCGWTNLDTEGRLGFVYELSDGKAMDKLPEGYDPYFYPEM